MAETKIKMSMDLSPLNGLARKSPGAFVKALKRGAIQFLNWSNLGSANSPRKPPIRFAVLRASSSAFVGKEFVTSFQTAVKGGGSERPTPARSVGSAPPTRVTWVWNTDYATRMHEWTGNWGPVTVQDGDAGRKWLEEHLEADRDSFYDVVRREFQKEAGL